MTSPLDGLDVSVGASPRLLRQGTFLKKFLARWGARVNPDWTFHGVVITLRDFQSYARVAAPFPYSKNGLLARIIAQQLELPWGWDWGWAKAPTVRIYGFTEEMAKPLAKGLFLWCSIEKSEGIDLIDAIFENVAHPIPQKAPSPDEPAVDSTSQSKAERSTAERMIVADKSENPFPAPVDGPRPVPSGHTAAPALFDSQPQRDTVARPANALQPTDQSPRSPVPSPASIPLARQNPAQAPSPRSGWPGSHTQQLRGFLPNAGSLKIESRTPGTRPLDTAESRVLRGKPDGLEAKQVAQPREIGQQGPPVGRILDPGTESATRLYEPTLRNQSPTPPPETPRGKR